MKFRIDLIFFPDFSLNKVEKLGVNQLFSSLIKFNSLNV